MVAALQLRRTFPTLQVLDWAALGSVAGILVVTGVLAAVLPFRHVLRQGYALLREM